MKRLLTQWTASGLLAGALLALPAKADDARQILLRSLEARPVTFVGTQTTLDSRRQAKRPPPLQNVYRKNQLLRIDFPSGQILFDDGETTQVYLPRVRTVERRPSRPANQKLTGLLRGLRNKQVSLELLPEDEVAGRAAYVVQIKNNAGPVRKVWIDKEQYVHLRVTEQFPDGHTITTGFQSIDFQKAPPAQLMAFRPPADAVSVEAGPGRPIPSAQVPALAAQWGGFLEPGYLPPNYQLRGYYRHMAAEKPMLVSVFEDRKTRRILSLFQGPAMGMEGVGRREQNRLKVLTARKGAADVILIGPAEEDLKRVMGSINAAP